MKRFIAGVVVMGLGINVWAVGSGGFANQVVGTRALGMGNAYSAVADDSSAVFFNPAGLTQIEKGEISLGAAPHFPFSKYESENGKEKMDSYTPVVPNFYAAMTFHSLPISVGVGMFAPYGLKTVWPRDGLLRYQTTESTLMIPEFSPTIAYKVTNKFSIGAGVVYARGYATMKSILQMPPEKELIIQGDGYGYGANSGVLFQPTAHQSFAVTYRSDIKIDMKGTFTLKSPSKDTDSATAAETSITLPPSVTLGYALKKDATTLAIDAEWVGFSSYRTLQIRRPEEPDLDNINKPQEYKDAWSVSTGLNHVWNRFWQSRVGYSFYPSVTPKKNWDPSVPDSNTHGFHTGASWTGKPVGLDLSYSYFRYQKVSIENDTNGVRAECRTSAHVVSANLNYKF